MILLQRQTVSVRVHRIEPRIVPGIELGPVDLAVAVPVMFLDPIGGAEEQAVPVPVAILIWSFKSVLVPIPVSILIRRVNPVAILIPVAVLSRNIDTIPVAVEIARLRARASAWTTSARCRTGTRKRKRDG